MRNPLRRKSWSPCMVGAGIGVLSWFTFATADKPIGVSTAFERTAALAGQAAASGAAPAHAYYAAPEHTPRIGWEWMFVVGILLGAWASATLAGDRQRIKVPELWQRRFGPSVKLRFAAAFGGGAVMMFGARLAQGCTSGHGISGTLQLAVSSWIFVALLFASGIATAFLLYGSRAGARHV